MTDYVPSSAERTLHAALDVDAPIDPELVARLLAEHRERYDALAATVQRHDRMVAQLRNHKQALRRARAELDGLAQRLRMLDAILEPDRA